MTDVLDFTLDGTLACDYCAEGLPLVDGWHIRVDPEGVEGDQRVPCAKAKVMA